MTTQLEESLLIREKQIFSSDIKDVFDTAVGDTCGRGVVGPGTGAAFVEHKVVRALKERMREVAIELATVELDDKKLFQLQQSLAQQYEELLLSMLSVPSCWGHEGSVDLSNHRRRWQECTKNMLDAYFESELRVSIKKRSFARNFNVKTTLLWILVGALIGNVEKIFDLIRHIIVYYLK